MGMLVQACDPSYAESINRRISAQVSLGINPISKIRDEGIAKVDECLDSKPVVLSSKPSTKKRREREKERQRGKEERERERKGRQK
jgi:hypothetical protein